MKTAVANIESPSISEMRNSLIVQEELQLGKRNRDFTDETVISTRCLDIYNRPHAFRKLVGKLPIPFGNFFNYCTCKNGSEIPILGQQLSLSD